MAFVNNPTPLCDMALARVCQAGNDDLQVDPNTHSCVQLFPAMRTLVETKVQQNPVFVEQMAAVAGAMLVILIATWLSRRKKQATKPSATNAGANAVDVGKVAFETTKEAWLKVESVTADPVEVAADEAIAVDTAAASPATAVREGVPSLSPLAEQVKFIKSPGKAEVLTARRMEEGSASASKPDDSSDEQAADGDANADAIEGAPVLADDAVLAESVGEKEDESVDEKESTGEDEQVEEQDEAGVDEEAVQVEEEETNEVEVEEVKADESEVEEEGEEDEVEVEEQADEDVVDVSDGEDEAEGDAPEEREDELLAISSDSGSSDNSEDDDSEEESDSEGAKSEGDEQEDKENVAVANNVADDDNDNNDKSSSAQKSTSREASRRRKSLAPTSSMQTDSAVKAKAKKTSSRRKTMVGSHLNEMNGCDTPSRRSSRKSVKPSFYSPE
jgi:hypothetical protein